MKANFGGSHMEIPFFELDFTELASMLPWDSLANRDSYEAGAPLMISAQLQAGLQALIAAGCRPVREVAAAASMAP